MSIRRLLTFAATSGALLLGAAVPVSAATTPPTVPPGCSYTPQVPKLTLIVTPKTIIAGQKVTTAGTLKEGSCPIRNAVISIQRRFVVKGVASGTFTTVKQTKTNSNGAYSTTLTARRNEQVRAHFNRAGGFSPATSPTPYPVVKVHTRLTLKATTLTNCRVRFTGTTMPVKKSRTVYIQKRAGRHKFHGFTTIGTATTGKRGHYSKVLKLSCSHAYNISTFIRADQINLSGRARTVFGIRPTH